MILTGGNANSFTVKAATTTTLARDENATAEESLQRQSPEAEGVSTTDFWWWPAPNADGCASHQHQQISSSSSQQQQQHLLLQQQLQHQQQQMQDCVGTDGDSDEFDAFDLSLLINGSAGDGYFGAGDADCGRVPSAAFSATVTVHTNATGDGDDYASSMPAQQQLDMQQLMSLCEDYCFFNENAAADAKTTDAVFCPATAAPLVTTTTTTTTTTSDRPAAETGQDRAAAVTPAAVVPRAVPATTTTTAARTGVANTTLLRSLLATDPLSPAAPTTSTPIRSLATRSVDATAPAVESTTGTAATTKTAAFAETADGKSNKHRLLIEMLRSGTCNDDVVVPVARPAPRRRPRTVAFGPDDGEQPPSGGGRRRLDPPPQQANGERKRSPLQRDNDDGGRGCDDDELLLYGSPYYTGTASASWLDRMVAAAAAATTSIPNSGDFYDPVADQLQLLLQHKDDYDVKPRVGCVDDIDSLVDECASDFCNDYGLGGSFDQSAVQDGGFFSAAAEMQAYSPPTAAQVPSVTPPPPTTRNDPSKIATASNDGGMAQQTQCWKPSADGRATSDDYYDKLLMTVMMEAPTDSRISSSTAADDGCVDDDVCTEDTKPPAALQQSSQLLERPLDNGSAPAAAATTTAATTTTTAAAPSSSSSQHIHLWQFLKELLTASAAAEDASARRSPSPAAAPSSSVATVQTTNAAAGRQPQMIRWLDRKQGVFKIEDSQAVARLWGLRKKRPAMNYDKLSRSLRQYYKKKIMQKTERSQRLVYQFCPPYNA